MNNASLAAQRWRVKNKDKARQITRDANRIYRIRHRLEIKLCKQLGIGMAEARKIVKEWKRASRNS